LVFLKNVFKQNGYNSWQIHRAVNRHPHVGQLEGKPNSVAFLTSVELHSTESAECWFDRTSNQSKTT
jgi:hypothetical protein